MHLGAELHLQAVADLCPILEWQEALTDAKEVYNNVLLCFP